MEFFIHPWYMAAGGVLVASPILIHLINRMRFKRIRWAAMEFLLKSQKRNRRRLIIEQLILLLLRILLVLLAAFLVARFLFAGTGTKGATHVAIIDNTLSMADLAREAGKESTPYDTGIEQLKEVVKKAQQAPSAQMLRVYLLSELDQAPLYEARINNRTNDDLDTAFVTRARKPSFRHIDPAEGIKKAVALLDEVKDGSKILHFISDFRDKDWAPGPDGDKVVGELKAALEKGIHVNLIDVAAPYRGNSKVALHHDNLAITELAADTRVAIEDADVEFRVKIMNYGTAEGRGFLQVHVNGQHDLARDQVFEKLPAGRETEHKFTLRFPRRARPGLDINPAKDSPEERERKRRLEREYFNIRVDIGAEPGGLNADNVRDMVIEVRKKVPILVVDGNKPEGEPGQRDIDVLSAFLTGSDIYELEKGTLGGTARSRGAADPVDLEKADLDLYPSIVLLNVADLPPAAVARLKKYVENGGSLCYFLGDEVRPDHYNTVLYKNGLFPLLLKDRPFDPLYAADFKDPEDRKKERERRRQTESQPKILFPNANHPLVERVARFGPFFRYLTVNVYWQAAPRSQWDPEGRKVEQLVVLPNATDIGTYKETAKRLAAEAVRRTEALAGKEAEYQRFKEPVKEYQRKVTLAMATPGGEQFRLSEALEAMLNDPGVKDDPNKPAMGPLWAHPSMKELKAEIEEFRSTVLYGDPLVVSRKEGKGRVVATLTPPGTILRKGVGGEDSVAWNNWALGDPLVQETFPVFMLDMYRYLVSEGQAPNRVVGEPVELQFDATRYERGVSWSFSPQPDLGSVSKPSDENGKGTMDVSGAGKVFTFAVKPENVARPGVYRFEFTHQGEGPVEDRKEVRAFAYNVDTAAESDLKRSPRDRLEVSLPGKDGSHGKLVLRSPGDDYSTFSERTPDASESPWLYLFFLLILVVEQAMAVHLSFHLKGSEGAAPAPAAQAAA